MSLHLNLFDVRGIGLQWHVVDVAVMMLVMLRRTRGRRSAERRGSLLRDEEPLWQRPIPWQRRRWWQATGDLVVEQQHLLGHGV
jgi:hypothetical protein